MTRTDVINYMIEQRGFTSYLEIGTQTRAQNFDKINCEFKTCVDPDPNSEASHVMTSDEYFKTVIGNTAVAKMDVIFIDGDHSYSQSTKDFNNALEYLNEGGVIIFHDALPDNEEYTKPIWCGDVYKTCLDVAEKYQVKTFTGDHGVCVVYPELQKIQTGNEVIDHSYNLERLKEELNAVDTLEGLLVGDDTTTFDGLWGNLIEEPVDVEVNVIDAAIKTVLNPVLLTMPDAEIKKAYKKKHGIQRLKKSITMEMMRKDLGL